MKFLRTSNYTVFRRTKAALERSGSRGAAFFFTKYFFHNPNRNLTLL